MPTVDLNRWIWGEAWDWSRRGEEWSEAWGGSEAQWFGAILPRIHAYLPAGTVLEIAPGFGRWTHYLRGWSERLVLVDLVDKCIEACRERFAGDPRLSYHVNDGRSLAMIPDGSVDFAFSFDSLVHADPDVLDAYAQELGRKLAPNGVGFFHHSNMGEYRRYFTAVERMPPRLRFWLRAAGLVEHSHRRSLTMTARHFATACQAVGLQCVSQEVVNWGTRRLIDCFSTFTRKTSVWARANEILRNPDFMWEATAIRRAARLYARKPGG